MDEIEALTQRATDLGRNVDFWNTIMLWGLTFAAFAAVVLGISTRLIVLRTGQQAKIQEQIARAKESRLAEELKEKDRLIAKTQSDSSNALLAQQEVELKLAAQQTRAAIAEKSLLELQERVKPRRLTDQQAKDFVVVLSKLPDTALKFGYTVGGGDESFNLLAQIMPLFKKARWKVPEQTSEVSNHMDIQVVGVALLIPGPPGTDPTKKDWRAIEPTLRLATLREAFRRVGMDLQFLTWFPNVDPTPELVIGSKPIF